MRTLYQMHILAILFLSAANSCAGVIIRIKPARILSYRKNQTTSASDIITGNEPTFSISQNTSTAANIIISPFGSPSVITDPIDGTSSSSLSKISTPASASSQLTVVDATITSTQTTAKVGAQLTHQTESATALRRSSSSSHSESTWPPNSPHSSTNAQHATTTAAFIRGANLTSRAGLLQIGSRTRIFFWFFGSESNASDPLVVWLQGQPNASSVYGAFDETGPYVIDARDRSVRRREHSWTRSFNVLYLDPYPGCGFSHSDNPAAYSLEYGNVGRVVVEALQQFYSMYPQLRPNALYLAAQSVGAKYAVVVAHVLLRMKPHSRPNLKGVLLGNAFVDECQLANYHLHLFAFGLVDVRAAEEVARHERYLAALIRAGERERAVDYWHRHIYGYFARVGYRSPYDVRMVNAFWDSSVAGYMNQANVRKKMAMGELQFQPAAKIYVTRETLRPIKNLMLELLSNIKVLLYHGQYDMFAPYSHSAKFLNQFGWPENSDFYISQRNNWYINKRLVGYWTSSENLTLMLIRNAGHTVGSTQPESMLQMLKDFVDEKFHSSNDFEFFKNLTSL